MSSPTSRTQPVLDIRTQCVRVSVQLHFQQCIEIPRLLGRAPGRLNRRLNIALTDLGKSLTNTASPRGLLQELLELVTPDNEVFPLHRRRQLRDLEVTAVTKRHRLPCGSST